MNLGYNTNGFSEHRLVDAARVLAGMGYRALAVTLDQTLLDPPDRRGATTAVSRITAATRGLNLHLTIETGARFILDPSRKHQPTLISEHESPRRRRIDYLLAAIDVAGAVGAEAVSLWSGTPDENAVEEALLGRLQSALAELLAHASRCRVRLAFEPEPGMLIDTMAKYERLAAALSHPLFGLTLDAGHVHCMLDGDVSAHIQRWRDSLWNVHIEDMRRGIHEHLPFGEGDMKFDPVFKSLRDIHYAGPVHVELARHSHDAVNMAQRSYEFLRRYFDVQSTP